MSKIAVKSVLVQNNCLVCISLNGTVTTLVDPGKVQWVLDHALPFFSKTPNAILELDLDSITETKIFDEQGNEIKYDSHSVTTPNGSYTLDLSPLAKFTSYAELHGYAVAPFMKKVAAMLDTGKVEEVTNIMTFLMKNELPLTKDGNILAFKVLYHDKNCNAYCDVFTHQIYQGIGDVVTMPKEYVVKNREEHCACGLHVCSIDYIGSYFNRQHGAIALVQVDPRAVVSVPSDYSSKVRVHTYQILGFVEASENDAILAKDLEKAPEFKKLLDSAISCEFTGINRFIESTVFTVRDPTDLIITEYGTFHNTFSKVEKKHKKEATLVDQESQDKKTLWKVMVRLSTYEKDPNIFHKTYGSSVTFLKEVRKAKEYFTWREMKVGKTLERYIQRRWKALGI